MTTNNDVLRAVYDLHSDVHVTRAVAWLAVAAAVEWLLARVAAIILAAFCFFKAVAKFGEIGGVD